MKDKILKIIAEHPKHYSIMIKNNHELYNWVIENTLLSADNSFPAQIYSAINNITNECHNGNYKKFRDINVGFVGCGRANTCKCTSESVSAKSIIASNSKTTSEKENIVNKRRATNLAKYGHINAGQSDYAKEKHSEFYSNPDNVKNAINKHQQTMLEKYNVTNPQQLSTVKDKTKLTLFKKYGVRNPMKNANIVSKSVSTRKQQYNPYNVLQKNYSKLYDYLYGELELELLTSADDYADVGGVVTRPEMSFKCIHCANIFNKRFDYASLPKCKQCYPTIASYKSNEELELLEFIKSVYTGTIISGSFGIINPYQIDIFLPDLKLGFEYNGLYWHSEVSGFKKFDYHKRKHDMMADKGNRLITIFSDEWLLRKDTVKQKIRSLLLTSTKIYARKCDLVKLTNIEAKEFINSYHIQGSPSKLPINYGLIHNGELVACMMFTIRGNKATLARFASSITVVGGASKLITAFIRDYTHVTEIESFSDNRWSSGDMYKVLGFKQTGTVPQMQYYVPKSKTERIHKLGFKKDKVALTHKIDASNMTEWELARLLKYDRIWDCGKIKWTLYIMSSI